MVSLKVVNQQAVSHDIARKKVLNIEYLDAAGVNMEECTYVHSLVTLKLRRSIYFFLAIL